MKKFRFIVSSLIVFCFLFFVSIAQAHEGCASDSKGYRYLVTFEIEDEIGKAKVYVYTDTWIYTEKSDVSMGNPHPDIEPTGAMSTVILSGGCNMLVGKGVLITKRPNTTENKVEPHNGLTITHPISVYDFIENAVINFENTECQ